MDMMNEIENMMKVMDIQQCIMSERIRFMESMNKKYNIQTAIHQLRQRNVSKKNLVQYYSEIISIDAELERIERNIIQFEDQIELLEFY